MLYRYGLGIGIQSILRGHVTRESLKNIIVPVNYWRTLEYRLVHEELRPNSADRILDIGSPKLFSLFLAQKYGLEIFATDIEKYFIADYGYFRSMRGIPESRYHLLQADGRRLEFETNSFDKVFSISVLEHIPDDGDSACIGEIARVLRPGGLFVATVPFSVTSRNEYRPAADFYWSGSAGGGGGKKTEVFFQRRYSEEDLHRRLIQPSGLTLRNISYFGEGIAMGEGREISNYLPPMTGIVQPLASRIFHRGPAASWRDIPSPLGALIALEKTRAGS